MLPWKESRALDNATMQTIRLRTVFECHKYDTQIGDVNTLAEFPLLLKVSAWRTIAALAEQLSQELLAAEAELCQRPDLHKALGIPPVITRNWSKGTIPNPNDVRVMRFDFHYTTEGWRISECNCDTPGGYNEAVGFTQLMQQHYPETTLSGNPAAQLASSIADVVGKGAPVALLYPTSFADDQQILMFLRPYLEACGLVTYFANPGHLRWQGQEAWLDIQGTRQAIGYVLRYFPAEWLPSIANSARWQDFFTCFTVPSTNPTTALMPQSKRFPLVWDKLNTPMTTWRTYLPTTCAVEAIPRSEWSEWVLKPIFGRFGDDIAIPNVASPKLWKEIIADVRQAPEDWIAQKPFQAIPMQSPDGQPIYPCIGVYTVNSRAAGLYGRFNTKAVVDSSSRDIAILLVEDDTK